MENGYAILALAHTLHKTTHIFLLLLLLALFAPSSAVFAVGETATTTPFSLLFTINRSQTPLAVARNSQLILAWSAPGAKMCKGSWANYRLRSTGAEVQSATKSQTFSVTCTSRTGVSKVASVTVQVKGTPLPAIINVKEVKTTAVKQPVAPKTSAETPAVSPRVVQPPTTEKPTRVATIQILSPNGDEVWEPGEGRNVSWLAENVPFAREGFVVDIVDERGVSLSLPTSTLPSLARSYAWNIPKTFPGGRYKVRVRIPGQLGSDTSDSFFTILKAGPGLTRKLACGFLGDVDSDGSITTDDIERIRDFGANPSKVTPDEFTRADVNVNGLVSASDVVEVTQYLLETRKEFSGCSVAGVSVDLLANARADIVTALPFGNITLSWTSNGGRCLFEDAYFPPVGSVTRIVGNSASTTYFIKCFGVGNARSASDSVTVVLRAQNKAPFIPLVEAPLPVQATKSQVWKVTVSDSDDTVLTLTVNFGDGTTATSTTVSAPRASADATALFEHTFATPGIYHVFVTAKDSGGLESTLDYLLVVTDPPRVSVWGGTLELGALFEGYRHLWLFEVER